MCVSVPDITSTHCVSPLLFVDRFGLANLQLCIAPQESPSSGAELEFNY